ncbi:MAG: carbonic anhydrase [Candidatus Lokiarchaeota archaeon]|nr:carbonic anhydrase [Candidatus Harpocratesius repetitus]
MENEIQHCPDDISIEKLKSELIARNIRWQKIKDGSNSINGSMKTVILSCIDSRVPIEKIFSAKPGEILVLKNAGNLITEDMLRSILVAILELGAKHVIIMGHTNCGMAIRNITYKIEHLKLKITPALKEKIEKSEHQTISEWFGFFDEGQWIKNAKIQGEKLKKWLEVLLKEEDRPNIIIALYNLDSGEVSFPE